MRNTMASPTLKERVSGIVDPGWLLFFAVRSYVLVLFETIRLQSRPFSEIRDEAFARFWNSISVPPPPTTPPQGSATLIPPLLANHSSGLVLELGPGSGSQTRFYAPAKSQITRIYGAEPCVPLHDNLLAAARLAGLEGKYEILNCGAGRDELTLGLAKAGLLSASSSTSGLDEKKSIPGAVGNTEQTRNRKAKTDNDNDSSVFDTIVCIRVLCSVANLPETLDTLYRLLKPGGKLLIVEHEVNPIFSSSSTTESKGGFRGSYIARAVQLIYTLMGWSFFVGGCHIQRDIESAVRDMGRRFGGSGGGDDDGWSEIRLKKDFGWGVLPYVSGVLVKRK